MDKREKGPPKGQASTPKGRKGQGFVEYLMIMALVGLGLTAALVAFRGQLSTALSTVGVGL